MESRRGGDRESTTCSSKGKLGRTCSILNRYNALVRQIASYPELWPNMPAGWLLSEGRLMCARLTITVTDSATLRRVRRCLFVFVEVSVG